MKKISYTFLGIVIGAFFTYFLTPKHTKEMDISEEISKPAKVITIEEAKILSKNWTDNRKKVVDSAARAQGATKDDTRSGYWTLDEIEEYISWARQEATDKGYSMTGIRVYLGVYGKNRGQAKRDLTTMFIAPTGNEKIDRGSVFSFQPGGGDIPVGPLNDAGGGQTGYHNE
ncbi:hypothetical protein [Aestuariibaculum sediminum]|uniref:Uncharacterized protein n=1 Tax=Aestuariibaculum sediminum TaxID=2770637 RepID=A0A8J6UFV3_9FLAO|nr:hypothetical protein [Aestuariibaculum sediminum]MBD0831721.1 hypothetical protein [Aestuariibaculum sediminum]